MLTQLRATLNSLSPTVKTVILKTTMVVLLSLGMLFIYLSTQTEEVPSITEHLYDTYLSQYHNQYQK